MSDTPKQPSESLSEDCAAALRDVRFGERLITQKEGAEAVLLPLVATKAAIDVALAACKGQPPEGALNRKQREINTRIEQTEEQLLQPLPKLPIMRRRASADMS